MEKVCASEACYSFFPTMSDIISTLQRVEYSYRSDIEQSNRTHILNLKKGLLSLLFNQEYLIKKRIVCLHISKFTNTS